MITSIEQVNRLAKEKGPKKIAILAPENSEFMLAVKKSMEEGYIDPILIGDRKKMQDAAEAAEFDIDNLNKIFKTDRQSIADLGAAMLFAGDVDITSKGQIYTAYVYRSVIGEEAKAGIERNISLTTLWEIPGLNRFVAIADSGVNICPDFTAKKGILKNAVYLLHILGYKRPRISVLSGQREVGGTLASFEDAKLLCDVVTGGELGECEFVKATSFWELLSPDNKRFESYDEIDISNMPEILLVPSLDTGNIICKLDVFLNIRRRSLATTTKGPILIPSRSDPCDSIVGEIAMGVVVADGIKAYNNDKNL